MDNVISFQKVKFQELEEEHNNLLKTLQNYKTDTQSAAQTVGNRIALINSKIDELKEEISHLQYECDKDEINSSEKAKERVIEYERSRVMINKMFPLLLWTYSQMQQIDQQE